MLICGHCVQVNKDKIPEKAIIATAFVHDDRAIYRGFSSDLHYVRSDDFFLDLDAMVACVEEFKVGVSCVL